MPALPEESEPTRMRTYRQFPAITVWVVFRVLVSRLASSVHTVASLLP